MDSFSCPFCNTSFSAATVLRSEPRWRCPRCQEALPAGLQEQVARQPATPAPATVPETPSSRQPAIRQANRKALGVVLTIMAVMAGVGLAYALYTQPFRRARDPRLLPKAAPVMAVSPAEMPILGYMPAGVQVLAGFQLGELFEESRGKELVAEPRPAWWSGILHFVERWAGLPIQDIDHLAAGLRIHQDQPSLVVGIQTRISLTGKQRPPKAEALEPYRGKPAFRIQLQPIGEGRVWYPDDRTILIVASLAQAQSALEALPYPPQGVKDAVPAPLFRLLTKRVPQNALGWMVGEVPAQGTSIADVAGFLPAKDFPLAELISGKERKIQGWALALDVPESPRLSGQIQAVDLKSRDEIRSQMEKGPLGGLNLRLAVPPPEAPEADRLWLSWQRRYTWQEWKDGLTP